MAVRNLEHGVSDALKIGSGWKLEHIELTMAGDITIGEDYPPILMLDPGGTTPSGAIMPDEETTRGLAFIIHNQADAAEVINIRNSADDTTEAVIGQDEVGLVVNINGAWVLVLQATAD